MIAIVHKKIQNVKSFYISIAPDRADSYPSRHCTIGPTAQGGVIFAFPVGSSCPFKSEIP